MLRYILNKICKLQPHQPLSLIPRLMNFPRNVPGDVPGLQPLEPRLLLSGTSFLVTSLADNTAEDGQLTLREAILAANTNTPLNADTPAGSATETDEITFAPSLFTNGPATITLNGQQLQITDSLNITAPDLIDNTAGSFIVNIPAGNTVTFDVPDLNTIKERNSIQNSIFTEIAGEIAVAS